MDQREYERKIKEWKSIIDKQEQRIQHLQSTAFQLANFYFVFQGVIFTAISNGTSSLTCHDKWFPILLSAITASVNLIAIFIIGKQYITSLRERDESIRGHNELARQKIAHKNNNDVHVHPRDHSSETESNQMTVMRGEGSRHVQDSPNNRSSWQMIPSDFNIRQRSVNGGRSREQEGVVENDEKNSPSAQIIVVDLATQKRIAYLMICMSVFIGFVVITTYGCKWILCKDRGFETIKGDEKCMKVCDGGKCMRLCPGYI